MINSATLSKSLTTLENRVALLRGSAGALAGQIDRWKQDLAPLQFHLSTQADAEHPLLVAILGGTGTGKSTLVNRLLGANVSAASFRRTFTAGAVAIARDGNAIAPKWLGVPHEIAAGDQIPARGKLDALVVVALDHPLLKAITLIDTPDLDGDEPAHHAQADRAFRWAQAIVFLVSPEKYQMTEMLPYYRLAARYAIPSLFVMNKCLTPQMLDDYAALLKSDHPEAALFSIARDDAAYTPAPDADLPALGRTLAELKPVQDAKRSAGLLMRATDLLGRLRDQVLSPAMARRKDVDSAVAMLAEMESPAVGVDVNPITEQLQRRLQQRSVLYLIGPGRILDRVRQVPGLLVRLPRNMWDVMLHGKAQSAAPAEPASRPPEAPDFAAILKDQFIVIQTRIDDTLRAGASIRPWMEDPACAYAKSRIDPDEAGKIATDELAQLNTWLQQRWNATPRDTAMLLKLVRYLPGGEKLTQWTETAPYLLAIIVATHHVFFGHVDLMILGGYTLATWITERLSNEVASRTRQANRDIAKRFEALAHQQIRKSIEWLQSQAPAARDVREVEALANELEESIRSGA